MSGFAADETGDMIVVTVVLPTGARDGLAVTVGGRTVTVSTAGGFTHELALSEDADTAHLHAQLFDRFLELRAPRVANGGTAGAGPVAVPVRILR